MDERAKRIFECLPATVRELVDSTGIPDAAVRRRLDTLEEAGDVQREYDMERASTTWKRRDVAEAPEEAPPSAVDEEDEIEGLLAEFYMACKAAEDAKKRKEWVKERLSQLRGSKP